MCDSVVKANESRTREYNKHTQLYSMRTNAERGITMTTTTLDFKAILEQAKRLKEGEKLPLQERKYTATVDKEKATLTLSITVPLTDVVKSAKGNNFVIPVANTHGIRGGGVAEFYSEDGLTCKLFADRVYLSTPELEKDKEVKKVGI